MGYSKVVMGIVISLLLVYFVIGEENISVNVSMENVSVEILPIEEVPLEIQPIEEIPVEEPTLEVPTDELTGGLVVEPVVEEQTILKTVMELVMDTFSVIRGQILELTAFLSYEDGTPAVDKEVTFFAGDEKIGSDLTDEAGKAQFSWDTTPFGPNVYVISAEYDGVSDGKNVVIAEVLPTEMLTAAVVVEPQVMESQSSGPVEEIKDCATIQFQEMENVYGTCTQNVLQCNGADNSSCATVEEQYQCKTGEQQVTKSYQQCKTVGLRINNGQKIVELDTKEYACSTQESGTQIIVTCDSVYDGNGDGQCKSGESCQRIVINGTSIAKSEKNSEEDYLADDTSYFMPEVGMEVIQ